MKDWGVKLKTFQPWRFYTEERTRALVGFRPSEIVKSVPLAVSLIQQKLSHHLVVGDSFYNPKVLFLKRKMNDKCN